MSPGTKVFESQSKYRVSKLSGLSAGTVGQRPWFRVPVETSLLTTCDINIIFCCVVISKNWFFMPFSPMKA